MDPPPVLDAETEALIAQMVADSFVYFGEIEGARSTHRADRDSQIGLSYLDYENPLTSYERELLENPLSSGINDGWTVSDAPMLSASQAPNSPGSTCQLPAKEIPWNFEAEQSEGFRQDRIMEAQHREVMDERISNGLRIPSPPPKARAGRIVAVRAPLPATSETLGPRISPLTANSRAGADEEKEASSKGQDPHQTSSDLQRTGRTGFVSGAFGHYSEGFPNHLLGNINTSQSYPSDLSSLPASQSRFRHLAYGTHGTHSPDGQRLTSSTGSSLVAHDKHTVSHNSLHAQRHPSSTLEPTLGSSQRQDTHLQIHSTSRSRGSDSRTSRTMAPRPEESNSRVGEVQGQLMDIDQAEGFPEEPSFVQEEHGEDEVWQDDDSMGEDFESEEDADGNNDEDNDNDINNEETTPTPHRSTKTKTKGKGKARAVLRSQPLANDHPTPRLHQRNRHTETFFGEEIDAVTGQSIIYIPWPRRDPEIERMMDSKVTEIRLGDKEGDECQITEVVGTMRMEDLDPEMLLGGRGRSQVESRGREVRRNGVVIGRF